MTKRFISCCSLAALAVGMMAAPAPRALKPAAKAMKASAPVTVASTVTPAPLRAPQKAASVQTAMEVLVEDFNLVPKGEIVNGKYTTRLAAHQYEPGRYIDNALTPNSGTWEGDLVYAGTEGSVVIYSTNPLNSAYIATPLGDYSGDVALSMRVRAVPANWGTDEEPAFQNGADIEVSVKKGGYDGSESANAEAIPSKLIYCKGGWHEVSFTFRNMDADSDGYLYITTPQALEIDWIKVTDACTYLPEPHLRPVTNVTESSMQLNWDDVRLSSNFYVDLWERREGDDPGLNEIYDFENGLPEGASVINIESNEPADYTIEDAVGNNGTKGLVIKSDNVAFATANYGKKLSSAIVGYRVDVANWETFNQWGVLIFDVLTDEGWKEYASDMLSNGVTEGEMSGLILEDETFTNQFYAIRVYALGLGEGNSLIFDDFQLQADAPFELVRVYRPGYEKEGWEDDDPYNYYIYTDKTSIVIEDLDPVTEYYYRVRSHNLYDFSTGEKHHVDAIATPVVKPATDITESGFTANWEPVSKAEQYTLSVYAAETVEEDTEDYCIFDEAFSKATGEGDFPYYEDLWNFDLTSMDEYTDEKGWIGYVNNMGNQTIGGADFMGGYLMTPPLMVKEDRLVELTISGKGWSGDAFMLLFQKAGGYTLVKFNENDEAYETLVIEGMQQGEQIQISAANSGAWALEGFSLYQDMKKGELVLKQYAEQTLPAGTVSAPVACSVDDSEQYMYTVKSAYTYQRQPIASEASDSVLVNVKTGESAGTLTNTSPSACVATEVARYAIDGTRVGPDYRGIVLIHFSDGSVRKTTVK